MQRKKADKLKKLWRNKSCEHPSFDRVYVLGDQTKDFACFRCGEVFSPGEIQELAKKHSDRVLIFADPSKHKNAFDDNGPEAA